MPTGTPIQAAPPPPKAGPLTTLRNWFFAGVVVAAPIGITIWLVWSFVSFVDQHIKPLIPRSLNPETYLDFGLPGLGIVVAVVGLVVLGAFAANLFGRWALRSGERLVARVPLVRSIYAVLKQVIETFASNDASSFKEAVLVEYPGKGLWVIGFVTSSTPDPEIVANVPDAIAVLIPASPNPAMGQLVYVSPERLKKLDMSVEQAAKLIISFGILTEASALDSTGRPDHTGK